MKIVTLRTKTFINLLFVIFFALLVTHFIILAFVQQNLVQERVQAARQTVQDVARNIQSGTFTLTDARNAFMYAPYINVLVQYSGTSGIFFGNPNPFLNQQLTLLAKSVNDDQSLHQKYSGRAWALFWPRPANVLIAVPFKTGTSRQGALSVACSIEDIYLELRPVLKIGWIYIGINSLLFTFIGAARLSNIVFKPLEKLTNRAEGYDPAKGEFWLDGNEGNTFRRLSASMQRIFNRLNQDQRQLQATVAALEKSNQKLTQAQGEMVRAEKLAAVGRISAGIAHEIGNPIGIVTGYLEMLRADDGNPSERKEFVQRSIDEIDRINRIIRQLLDFARSSGTVTEAISLHAVIQDVMAVLESNPLSNGVQMELKMNAPNDCILADPDQIRQVLLNVIINALDAMTSANVQNPRFLVESAVRTVERSHATRPLDMISIVCKDNGPGIGDAHLPFLLEPFFTTKAPGKGTGLGLAVSYMIIENNGGRLKIQNRAEGGAVVTIDLPLQDSETPSEKEGICLPS